MTYEQITDNIPLANQNSDQIKRIFNLDWAIVPIFEDLKIDFDSTVSKHNEQEGLVQKWSRAIDAIPLTEKEVLSPFHSRYTPKLVKKALEARCDNLIESFNRLPNLFIASGQGLNDEEIANQESTILNQQLKVDRVRITDDFVKRVVSEGSAVLRINWQYEQKAENVIDTNEEGEELAYEQISIIKNEPIIEVIPTKNIYVAPNCKRDLEDADFIVEEITTDLYSLYAAGKYDNLEELKKVIMSRNLKNNNNNEDISRNTSNTDTQINAREVLKVYEYWGYWDINGDFSREHIIASWCEGVLIRLEKNPYPNNLLPYTLVSYSKELDSIYGKADAEIIESNQKVSGALYRGILNTLSKASSGQVGIPVGMFPNDTERQKFNQGKTFSYNPGLSLEKSLYISKFPEIPTSAVGLLDLQSTEIQQTLGTAAPVDPKPSAIGNPIVMSGKEIGALRRLSAGLLDTARKIIAINSIMLSDEDKGEILGREAIPIPLSYNQILKDITLEIATPEAINAKISKFSFLLQTLGQTLPFPLVQKILASIVELSDEPNLAHEIRNYQEPEPTEEDIIDKQLEARIKAATVMDKENSASNKSSDTELKKAQADNIRASTTNTNSDTNIKDSELLERERESEEKEDNRLEKALDKELGKDEVPNKELRGVEKKINKQEGDK